MIVEAPQPVLDRIIDRFIEENVSTLTRWIWELDACRLDWRRESGVCPCGEFVS
jgi:hypothetical protein